MKRVEWKLLFAAFLIFYSCSVFAQNAARIERSEEGLAAEKALRKKIKTPRKAPVIIEDKTKTEKNIEEEEEKITDEPNGGAKK